MSEMVTNDAVVVRSTSPYDAEVALAAQLDALRAAADATRVSVWVHEATTEMAVPFRRAVTVSAPSAVREQRFKTPVALARSPFLATVIRKRRPMAVYTGDSGPAATELASYGIRSAHGEPLLVGDEVVGVLTVEPATAATPELLRAAAPGLALATAEAWTRRSEQRRVAQAGVLLGLIETAATATSLEHLLAAACEQLAELGEVDRACVFLLPADGLLRRRPAGQGQLGPVPVRPGAPAARRERPPLR
ncbi:GAF domain-containing protein [Modestobacter sp. DSM 44400]|uniref:GAF domain-containing protein n=1 Tax=Modestobacter sp. DSM 44400 TaxID=1550230 RepID=UPI00089B4D92|nr:GAF domain-containing protein [Modestobacter sp. DSM 44400]SDX79552.1 GAF domain-containing protein [Modestobacter sp. DSM 44400]